MARDISHARRLIALSAAGAFVLFVLIMDLNGFRSMHPKSFPKPDEDHIVPIRNLIQALWAPSIHPITEPTFVDRHSGLTHSFSGPPIWTEPLRNKICIVDVDTRPLNDTNEAFNPDFSWDNIDGVSPGILNHYLYAMIHGYDYKHIHTTNYPDRSAYWTKIPAMGDTLRDYRIVVTLDADAIFRNLELPYEWLLNRWNMTGETSFAMPLDPSWDQNKNKFGRLNTNAGFITVQNLPRTHEILRAWEACPERPDCAHFKDGWPAEQGAFGEFIRYQYNRTTDITEFACTDGNGFPEMGTECEGLFVTHYTIDKTLLKKGIADSLARSVMGMMHTDLQLHKQAAVVERTSNAFLD